jgi:AraC family transcriptional regulator
MHQPLRPADWLRSSLPPGQRARALGRFVTSAGNIQEMVYAPGLCEERHYHSSASLIYVVAGTHWAGHTGGGDTCHAGTVRFLPAGEPHETYFPAGSWCLEIAPTEALMRLATEERPVFLAFGELPGPRAAALGARLHEEFANPDVFSEIDVEAVTLQLLLAGPGDPPEKAPPPWVVKIREMLCEELQARFTLAALSGSVGRHPVQVSRQFHHYFGCTIGEYLRRARVARAQSLLRRSDLQIGEIALACGFSDQSHFTTAFRRLTGVPPRRYRLQREARFVRSNPEPPAIRR